MAKSRKKSLFGKNLTHLLEEKQISVREAARIAHVSSSTIVDWKSGTHPTDFLAIRRLSQALGVTLSFLLTGEEEIRTNHPMPVSAVFDPGEVIFDGYALIKIESLLPKRVKPKGEGL